MNPGTASILSVPETAALIDADPAFALPQIPHAAAKLRAAREIHDDTNIDLELTGTPKDRDRRDFELTCELLGCCPHMVTETRIRPRRRVA